MLLPQPDSIGLLPHSLWAGTTMKKLLYKNSIKQYEKAYNNYHFERNKVLNKQYQIDANQIEKKYESIVLVPSIIGSSYTEQLLRLVDKINLSQSSHDYLLKKRREVTKLFQKDPVYDWQQYDESKLKKKKEEDDPLGKISVLNQMTNEETMYYEAAKTAHEAKYYRDKALGHISEDKWLSSNSRIEIVLPKNTNFVSFVNEAYVEVSEENKEYKRLIYSRPVRRKG